MDGHIGRLNCHYRIAGSGASAGLMATRLDRLAREQVIAAYAAALDAALGDDPTVYVLRRVNFDLTLIAGPGATDGRLAERWGRCMASAVIRRLASDDVGLVRFADQADYVAHF